MYIYSLMLYAFSKWTLSTVAMKSVIVNIIKFVPFSEIRAEINIQIMPWFVSLRQWKVGHMVDNLLQSKFRKESRFYYRDQKCIWNAILFHTTDVISFSEQWQLTELRTCDAENDDCIAWWRMETSAVSAHPNFQCRQAQAGRHGYRAK